MVWEMKVVVPVTTWKGARISPLSASQHSPGITVGVLVAVAVGVLVGVNVAV